jgi:hypothetical protein
MGRETASPDTGESVTMGKGVGETDS